MKTHIGIVLIIAAGLVFASCSKLQNENVLATSNCSSCHGSVATAAPPPDAAGNMTTTTPAVGAHQVHLSGSTLASAVDCSSCHIVPSATGPGIHPDGSVGASLVSFSGVAMTETNTPGTRFYDSTLATVVPQPTFNTQTLKCANTYCHGNFKGGNNFAPTWTVVNSTQDSCGSCHGIPPADSTHLGKGITLQTCYYCHSPMMGPGGVIADPSLHVNGTLELYGKSVTAW